jgi:hypothetical protein
MRISYDLMVTLARGGDQDAIDTLETLDEDEGFTSIEVDIIIQEDDGKLA